jgi:hypothetical protein
METNKVDAPVKAKNYSKAEQEQIIEKQRRSKLTIPEFCIRENINSPRFYAWRSKLNKNKFHSMTVSQSPKPAAISTDDFVQKPSIKPKQVLCPKFFVIFFKLWRIEISFSV